MEPSKFSDEQLLTSLGERFAIERDNSHHILLHLKEIQSRRLHVKRGFSSMFSMLIKHSISNRSIFNRHHSKGVYLFFWRKNHRWQFISSQPLQRPTTRAIRYINCALGFIVNMRIGLFKYLTSPDRLMTFEDMTMPG